MKAQPTEAEVRAHGIIRWDLPRGRSASGHQTVLRICECGQEDWIMPSELRRPNRPAEGWCRPCCRRELYRRIGNRQGEAHARYKGRLRTRKDKYIEEALYPGERFYEMGCSMRTGHVRYVGQHRLVVARAIDRALEPWEHVHHKNGDPKDNRLENLELVSAREHAGITAMQTEINRLNRLVERQRATIRELRQQLKR